VTITPARLQERSNHVEVASSDRAGVAR
jgi:hypothetical protein